MTDAPPNLRPVPLGLVPSFGCGDRLGLATPGHVRAFQAAGAGIAPIFAQQSARELARTGRTPRDVLNDATLGAFRADWRGPVGADADHVKTPADIDAYAAEGYSLYTFDLGDHLDARAITTEDKYGRAIAHAAALYRHLAGKGIPFEVEISVDETATPTTPAEHAHLAFYLQGMGVTFVSLAPRFVGRFEKGIEYIGDLAALRQDFEQHAAVARQHGPYKLSLHSGSDKFSVYAMFAEATRGLFHVKTAGTSYLEALRVLAVWEPEVFRAVSDVAMQSYETDRATYHVSAEPGRWWTNVYPLAGVLDNPRWRQMLHVTFGSVMAELGAEVLGALAFRQDEYAEALEAHFVRHLQPLAGKL